MAGALESRPLARIDRLKYGSPMACSRLLGGAALSAMLSLTNLAAAQAPPAPPTAGYGEPAAPPAGPPPASPAEATPPPAAPPPTAADASWPGYPAPPPGYTPPPTGQAPAPGYGYAAEPPPPPQKPAEPPKIPDFSVRIDPLRWLIFGKLGLELEVEIWKFISLELVPVFVLSEQPPAMNDFDDVLSQHSNGIGALAGTSIGVGFWLSGTPMRGQVLRAILTNEGYTYRSKDGLGTIDEVDHTERHFYGFIGSYDRWGPFTIGGGIGVGVELNDERRCFTEPDVSSATSDCSDEQFQIALDREVRETAGLNSSLHPIQLMGRISLGFVF